ncbi:MAG: DNA primase [Gemmatimonadaceae bacterium]|nr:DNA primase [Gemmatimonadaceae bacterium]
MIPDHEVERVRESADIVAVIGEYVELKRQGTDFRGPCPFHQGTHRNFSVSPRKRLYYCFVCHEHGDVFTFVQKRLGLDWPGSVRHVAEKTGIELHEVTSSRHDGPDPREPLWEANAAAAQYFQRILWEDELGAAAREYLGQRTIDRALAERFGLGFAPREIGLMRAHLNTLGIDDARQLEAGLLVRRAEEEEPRPRFRQRLVFPILDLSGRGVGFGGRLIGPGEPKYLNSAESAVYSKGALLYNLNQARLAARRDDRLFLVEGYFDAMRLVGAGVDAVVAPLGTALTEAQAELVKRYTKNVFLLYDSDKAGLKATFKAGDLLLRQGLSVRVVSLPAGEDPDTFVQKQGREALERATEAAIDVFDRKVQILERGGWFADLHRRRKAVDYLLPTIRACIDPVMRDMYLARASQASGVARQVLEEEAGAAGRRDTNRAPAAPATVPAPPQPQERPRAARPRPRPRGPAISAERELIRAMLRERAVIERVAERFGPDSFQEPTYRAIFERVLALEESATIEQLAEGMSHDAIEAMQGLLAEPEAIQHLERTVEDSLSRLEVRRLEERNRAIDALTPMAQGEEKDVLIAEKMGNQREIARLGNALGTP